MRVLLHDYSGHPLQVQLARALARRGHVVRHLYSARIQTPRGTLRERVDDPPGFEVAAIDSGEPFAKYNYARRVMQEWHYGSMLRHEIATFRPDVVLMSNTPLGALSKPQHWCRAHGTSFVFWLQDLYSVAIAHILRQKLGPLAAPFTWYYYWLEGRLLRHSDQVVSITEDFTPQLFAWGVAPERTTTIENWSPLEELPLQSKDNEFAREHGLHEKTVLLYSGTLGLKHNPRLLLAVAEACREDPGIAVVVVSEGLGADWLARRKIERGLRNLCLLPFQPFARMPEVMGAADLLLAILEPEAGIFSVPGKVLTYLCAGKPLLAAMPPTNLAARIIVRERAGLVVLPNDEAGFITAARALALDPERRASLGAAGRAYAERTFDIKRIASQFESLLARACQADWKG
jgi:glycosyltransferase involved in cell wall biosynthesis